jgi:capsular polysaccharide transport system ATP-binding protein
MISLYNVTKVFRDKRHVSVILDNVTVELPTDNVAVLGAGGSGKSSLLRLMCGSLTPNKGRVVRDGRASWPIGSRVAFSKHMTGAENVRFIARIYDIDPTELLEETREISQLGDYFDRPIANYTGNMRAQLVFATCMAIDFDIYLIDETVVVGDFTFREKCRDMLHEKSETSQLVVVSNELSDLREFCRAGIVLENGTLHYFDDLEEAIAYHEELERT